MSSESEIKELREEVKTLREEFKNLVVTAAIESTQ